MTDLARVTLAARIFTLAGLVSIAALLGVGILRGALAVLLVAAWAQVFSMTGRIPAHWLLFFEGTVVAVLAVALFPNDSAVKPYLVVPVLVGGLTSGLPGVSKVLLAEAFATSIAWATLGRDVDRVASAQVLLWLVAGMGLGLVGVAWRRSMTRAEVTSPYRDALDLIKRLHALSGQLHAGLDAVSLADEIMRDVAVDLSVVQAVVMVRSPAGSVVPLRFSDGASTVALLSATPWVESVWESRAPVLHGQRVAIPLRADQQPVAMFVADCIPSPDIRKLSQAAGRVDPKAVQLYAAMLFSDIRDTATSEERQRLAREVHDGVAQDVASLGYLVDNLTESAVDVDQVRLLNQLRREVTRVVGELRHSVFDLRNEVGAGQGLGQSISSFARHVGSHSDLTVHVTLDEASTRLHTEIESELLRIAQEAINNSRKHSGGRNLWVHCTVAPPYASIEVRDDGAGLGVAREDSHGLRIMRERAERIGAELTVETPAKDNRGTRVSVRLPAKIPSLSEV